MSARHRQSGFTLLELIVASSITVLVVGATVLIVSNLAGARQRAASESLLQQEARAAAGAIATALRNAHRVQQSRELLFEGIASNGGMSSDRIRFFTVSHRRIRADQPESDVHEVAFFLSPIEEGDLPMLMRRTDPTLNQPLDEGGVVERVAQNIVALRIGYHDGEAWLEEWEPHRSQWPVAVRIEVVAADPDDGRAHAIRRLVNFPHHHPEQGQGQPQRQAAAQGGRLP